MKDQAVQLIKRGLEMLGIMNKTYNNKKEDKNKNERRPRMVYRYLWN